MEKEFSEEKTFIIHKIEHFIAIGMVSLSLFCICLICCIKKMVKRREYDEDQDNTMIQNYFQNKSYVQPSPYGQQGYDSTYSQSYKYDDSFDTDQVQVKNIGNIHMRVVSLHDDVHGINQSNYNSLGSETPYLK